MFENSIGCKNVGILCVLGTSLVLFSLFFSITSVSLLFIWSLHIAVKLAIFLRRLGYVACHCARYPWQLEVSGPGRDGLVSIHFVQESSWYNICKRVVGASLSWILVLKCWKSFFSVTWSTIVFAYKLRLRRCNHGEILRFGLGLDWSGNVNRHQQKDTFAKWWASHGQRANTSQTVVLVVFPETLGPAMASKHWYAACCFRVRLFFDACLSSK